MKMMTQRNNSFLLLGVIAFVAGSSIAVEQTWASVAQYGVPKQSTGIVEEEASIKIGEIEGFAKTTKMDFRAFKELESGKFIGVDGSQMVGLVCNEKRSACRSIPVEGFSKISEDQMVILSVGKVQTGFYVAFQLKGYTGRVQLQIVSDFGFDSKIVNSSHFLYFLKNEGDIEILQADIIEREIGKFLAAIKTSRNVIYTTDITNQLKLKLIKTIFLNDLPNVSENRVFIDASFSQVLSYDYIKPSFIVVNGFKRETGPPPMTQNLRVVPMQQKLEMVFGQTYTLKVSDPVILSNETILNSKDISFMKMQNGKPSLYIDPFTVPKSESLGEGSFKFLVAFDAVNNAKVVFFQRQETAFIEVYPEASGTPVLKVPIDSITFENYGSIFVASSTKGRVTVGLVEEGSLGGKYNPETMALWYPKVYYVSFYY